MSAIKQDLQSKHSLIGSGRANQKAIRNIKDNLALMLPKDKQDTTHLVKLVLVFIILKDTNSYVSTKDQVDEMPLHHGKHPHVKKHNINRGLSIVSHEVVNDHGRKMTFQGH